MVGYSICGTAPPWEAPLDGEDKQPPALEIEKCDRSHTEEMASQHHPASHVYGQMLQAAGESGGQEDASRWVSQAETDLGLWAAKIQWQ